MTSLDLEIGAARKRVELLIAPNESYSDERIRRIAKAVDRSLILPRLDQWRSEDGGNRLEGPTEARAKGGRPSKLSSRTVLIGLVLLALEGEPMLLKKAMWALYSKISPEMRAELGVDEIDLHGDPEARSREIHAVYTRVYRRFHDLTEPIEPYALPTRRKQLTKSQYDEVVAGRNPTEVATRRTRAHWVMNEILEMSLRLLPRTVRRRWRGSACVDATVLPLAVDWRRGGKNSPLVFMEPDASWYKREYGGKQPKPGLRKLEWGYEATTITSGPDDPKDRDFVTSLVYAMSLHKPATAIADEAVMAARSLVERGHPTRWLAGDLAYFPNSQPDLYQVPMRGLGYWLTGTYRKDQLGIAETFAGAILVEGAWYCPSMPAKLINATIDYYGGRTSRDTWLLCIEQRGQYLLRPKETPADPMASVPMMCPSAGECPTCRCPLKASSLEPKHDGKTTILNPPKHKPRICVNKTSVAFPPSAGAKSQQRLQFGSKAHDELHGLLRNCVEGMNGYVKAAAHGDLENPGRRLARGYGSQCILIALTVMASNVRKILSLLNQLEVVNGALQRRNAEQRRDARERRRTIRKGHWPGVASTHAST
jgi:hypothetical protein